MLAASRGEADDGCCGEEGAAMMNYVGGGKGEYVQETTYRFVGGGHGDFDLVVPTSAGRCRAICGGVICAALLLVGIFLLFVGSPLTSSTMKAVAGFGQFNCDVHAEGGVGNWPLDHLQWCCEHEQVGCPAEPAQPFNCQEGLALWRRGWSKAKKDWCCDHEELGCVSVPEPEPKPETTSLPYDCRAGFARWETGWSASKKAWCCENEKRGCQPKCLTQSCDATCYHDVDGKGHGHVTCRDRVLWAKDSSPQNVDKTLAGAISLVNKECACQCACAESDFTEAVPVGTCLLWGDPHITTFDGLRSDYFGQGIVWMVKSAQVKVQVRYMATPYTNGLAATHDIVVGGPFLKGHVLKVGPLNGGHISWDGQPILEEFGEFDPDGLGKLSYDDQGQLVDSAQEHVQKRIVHVSLPGRFFMQIFRWENHLNVRIRMPPTAEQDGHCGNFNGDRDDDSRDAVIDRLGVEVSKDQVMFDRFTERIGGKRLRLDDCPADRRAAAEKVCLSASDSLSEAISNRGKVRFDQDLLEGCMFDVCFAGERYAMQDEVEGW